jgi:hypothetical protein
MLLSFVCPSPICRCYLQMYSAVSSILSLMHFLMHTGSVYNGVEFSKRLCGVSVIRRYQLYESPIISCGVFGFQSPWWMIFVLVPPNTLLLNYL